MIFMPEIAGYSAHYLKHFSSPFLPGTDRPGSVLVVDVVLDDRFKSLNFVERKAVHFLFRGLADYVMFHGVDEVRRNENIK
jgi:hypothetical protein